VNRAARGFTLVELMLAIMVLAIMMTLVYGVVVSTVQAAHRIEEITLGTEIGPSILTRVREDLEAAFLPGKEPEHFVGYNRKGAGGGDGDRVDFVSAVMAYGAEREGEEALFHGVNEVGYQVKDNPKSGNASILYRREDYFLDAEPLKGGRLTELYDRVRHFNLEYWDGEAWQPEWSSQKQKNTLPKAVKIDLKILVDEREMKDVEKTYSTIVTFTR
jgi:prepilin-type N-terminal cleavage/methylation domain-containing protein